MFLPRYSAAARWGVILLIVTVAGLYGDQCRIQEDALDLLPDQVLSSKIHRFQQLGLMNRIYIHLRFATDDKVLGAAQWQALKTSVIKIGSRLRQENLFSEVVYKLDDGYAPEIFKLLWNRLPYLLTAKDYKIIESMLTEKGLRHKLLENFLLLNTPAGIALKQQITRDPLGLSLLAAKRMQRLKNGFAVNLKEGLFTSDDGKSCLIWLDSSVALTDSRQALQVQKVIESAINQGAADGVQAELIGALPHTLANAETIKNDLKKLIPAATIALAIFLFAVFRKWQAFLVLCVPFLAAPPSIALLQLYSHKVSGLALGFGIVLLGLAVDFAVHIYLALEREPGPPRLILDRLRKPIIIAWCTTTGVFVILLGSSVPSHRQMALLAICGVSFAVLISWLLIPTFTRSTAKRKKQNNQKTTRRQPQSWLVITCWTALVLAGAAVWPRLSYNGDIRLFDATTKKIQKAEANFRKTWNQAHEQAFLFSSGDSLESALALNDQAFISIPKKYADQVHSISPLLPGPELTGKRASMWQDFWRKNKQGLAEKLRRVGAEIGFKENSFASFFHFLDTPLTAPDNRALLQGVLRPLLISMVREKNTAEAGLQGDAVILTVLDLEQDLLPRLLKLEKSHPKIALLSTTRWRQQVEQLLREDIVKLATIAGIFIFLITAMFFRRLALIIAALAPVCSALASMALFAFMTDKQLNLMHVLMGLMVTGLSVDYGIFSVCANEDSIYATTRKAISTCAVSTCIGFGVLAMASHPALKTIGLTVLISITIAWPTALYVTPAITRLEIKQLPRLGTLALFVVLLAITSCSYKPAWLVYGSQPQANMKTGPDPIASDLLPDKQTEPISPVLKPSTLDQSLWRIKIIHADLPKFSGIMGVEIRKKEISYIVLDATGLVLFEGLIAADGSLKTVRSLGQIQKSGLPDILADSLKGVYQTKNSFPCHWYMPMCVSKQRTRDDQLVTIKRFGPFELWRTTAFMHVNRIERIVFSRKSQALILDMRRMQERNKRFRENENIKL